MKVLFPGGEATKEEIEELLTLAIESRKRVKDQILQIDETFTPVKFSFTNREDDSEVNVLTLEERQHPSLAKTGPPKIKADGENRTSHMGSEPAAAKVETSSQPGHLVVPENSKGYSYRRLFSPLSEKCAPDRSFGSVHSNILANQKLHGTGSVSA